MLVKYFKAIFLITIILMLFLLSCAQKNNKSDLIKFGAILPLTGPSASLGEWFKMGYILAEKEANQSFLEANFKKKFKIIIEDGKGEQTSSIFAYKKLVNVDKVKFITTTLSTVSLAIKPLAIQDKVLFFGNAAHPDITGDSPLIFRHSNVVDKEGSIIVDFIKSLGLNNARIFILASEDDFGRAFLNFLKDGLSNLNFSISSELYKREETDFRDIIIKNLKPQPSIVMVIGFSKYMGLAIKNLKEINYKGIVISNFGFTDPNVIQLAGEAAKGVYYVDYDYDYYKEPLISLNKLSNSIFKKDFPPVGLLAYNTIMILKEAILAVGEDVDKISEYIIKKKTFSIGEIEVQVNEKGDILPPMKIKKYGEGF